MPLNIKKGVKGISHSETLAAELKNLEDREKFSDLLYDSFGAALMIVELFVDRGFYVDWWRKVSFGIQN